MRVRMIWLWLMVVMMLVAACGGSGGGDDDAPVVPAGGDTQAQPTPALASVTLDDPTVGNLTASYPSNWVARAHEGGIYIASDAEFLEINIAGTTVTPQPGQVAVNITFFPLDMLAAFQVDPAGSAAAVIQAISGFFVTGGNITSELGAPQTFDAASKDAALMLGTVTEDGIPFGLMMVAVKLPEGFATMIASAAPDQIAEQRSIVEQIAGSITYRPPAG